jgi:hypothetical protein
LKNLHHPESGASQALGLAHPLLRIVIAAALATTITWLGGLLFGPLSDARARQLAHGMSATPQRGAAEITASAKVQSQPRDPRTTSSVPAA